MIETSDNSQRDFQESREEMVRYLAEERGISDRRVLQAMSLVPREEFVPPRIRTLAYTDQALPIECGQTISQPYTVAFMCEALELTGSERVLEVGTGTGYGAAVLSKLAAEVITVERISQLAATAARRLTKLKYDNVRVFRADGTLGWPELAPYDRIIVTAAAETLPAAYLEQLKPDGRIVIPIGRICQGQEMCRITIRNGATSVEELGTFAFVPLIDEQSL